MKPKSIAMALLLLTLLSGGCATAGSSGSGQDRDVITRSQLEGLERLDVYQAIQRIKPVWLRSARGVDSFGASQARRGLRVYLNGTFYGGVSDLRGISAQDVDQIRFLDKREATLRFGTDHGEGALLITTLTPR